MGEDCCAPGTPVHETPKQKAVKFLLLLSVVPIFFLLPYVAGYVIEFFQDKEAWFYPLWAMYGAAWLYLAATKYHQHTWESWFTQLLTWALFSLGIFTVIGVFNFIDQRTKRTMLIVWGSLTFIPYLFYVYKDETNHRKLAELEERKQKRREEKERLRDEKRKQERLARKKAASEKATQ